MNKQLAAVAVVLWATLLAEGAQPEKPKIDPRADQHLKAMSTYLAGLKTFSFQVEEFFDDVQDDGQKLQFSNQRQVSVSRPGKMFGETVGDTADSQFYYDGKTVTVFDREAQDLRRREGGGHHRHPCSTSCTEKYGMDQPLADLLFSDPHYKVFTEHVKGGAYVGLNHVGKVKCHHLAFRQKTLDWQIWIDASDKPLPRKLLITFKRQAGEPQFTALLHRWDVNPAAERRLVPVSRRSADIRKVSDFIRRHGEPKAAATPPVGN